MGSNGDTLLGRPRYGNPESLNGWIGPTNLRFALSGEGHAAWNADQWSASKPPFVKDEFRPGVAIEAGSSTARHGMLYFAEALRFAPDSGLLGHLLATVDDRLHGRSLSEGSGLAGRRGRLAAFRTVELFDPDWEGVFSGNHIPAHVGEGDRFWLLAITPVRAEPEVRIPPVEGVQIEFQAKLTGRPFPIGGFQFADGKPRPNHMYLPAGSAWLFRIVGGDSASRREAILALHDRHPLGPPSEAAFGFGHTLIGIGPRTTEEGT
jgi:CRISPR-associated protein Cmr3